MKKEKKRIVLENIIVTDYAAEGKALAKIDEYSKFWMAIPGTRGAIGKKTVNSSTYFNALFDVEESVVEDEELLIIRFSVATLSQPFILVVV